MCEYGVKLGSLITVAFPISCCRCCYINTLYIDSSVLNCNSGGGGGGDSAKDEMGIDAGPHCYNTCIS